ncbi:peptide chain release factor N(5)-glutamine methyltransferase [Hyphomicrobium sp.]|jgi:release factor glutamine methyltransferase|uniref:peptide chain release factor N(5)-glutamine methyltransferase n=1 Tax=Hyphomicrobium sp. TaxID=82 RepID=UPI003568D5B7
MAGVDADPLPAVHFRSDQSIGDALAQLTRVLRDAGIDTPQRDARFLLRGLLGLDGAKLLSCSARALGDDAERISDAARRRAAHEPVSRILGHREFYGRDFIVTPDVLDPRPDTEAVVEAALGLIKSRGLSQRPLSIVDVGTGSGILIVTLLAELPNARGVGTDVSQAALEVARRNAASLGVKDRVHFVATSGLDGCAGPFDLVISNPPYISTGEIDELERDVKDFDPLLALDGGADGLCVYRKIAQNIVELQRPLMVVLEVGSTQAEAVIEIFSSAGGQLIGRHKDLGGHTRAVALEIHL